MRQYVQTNVGHLLPPKQEIWASTRSAACYRRLSAALTRSKGLALRVLGVEQEGDRGGEKTKAGATYGLMKQGEKAPTRLIDHSKNSIGQQKCGAVFSHYSPDG